MLIDDVPEYRGMRKGLMALRLEVAPSVADDMLSLCEKAIHAVRDAAYAEGSDLAKADKSTLDMWQAGADFFSSKYSLAERCQMARDCYEAMIRARESRPTEKGVVDANQPKPWHYPSADESKRS